MLRFDTSAACLGQEELRFAVLQLQPSALFVKAAAALSTKI